MEIRQLEAFVAVMTVGSVTGAARLLQRSQPAISRQIQELEAQLGAVLLERHGPRVSPTAQGFALYEEAERIVHSVRRIQQLAQAPSQALRQPLLIAATPALSLGLVTPALASALPGLGCSRIELLAMRPEKVVHEVLNGLAHLGLCSLPLDHQRLQLHWVAQADCLAVLPTGHRLAKAPVVALRDLAGERLVGMHNPLRLKQQIDAAWRHSGGQDADTAIQTNSSINAQALVRAGLGLAILDPLTLSGAPLEGVVYRPLDVSIPFYFGAISAQGKALSAQTQQLLEALRRSAEALAGCRILPTQAIAELQQSLRPLAPSSSV